MLSDGLSLLPAGLGVFEIGLIILLVLITSAIHGATGVAGGSEMVEKALSLAGGV